MKPYWIFSACILMSACAATHHQNDSRNAAPPAVEAVAPEPVAANQTESNISAATKPSPPPQADFSRNTEHSSPNPSWPTETGYATYYAENMEGRLTASGEPYDAEQLTAAHKTIPIGSLVRVTNQKTKRHVVVRINDRWGGGGDRIINVSRQAAEQLGFGKSGLVFVHVDVESIPEKSATAPQEARAAPLPSRLEETESVSHSKLSICQNEADILGLTGEFFRNHVAGCLSRGK